MSIRSRASGFTLLELMVAMALLLVISAAVISLLNTATARYNSQQQQLDALQDARVGMDQLSRDIHRAGYPPINSYYVTVPATEYAIPLVGLVSGAINQSCTVNGGATPCSVPGPFDLAIEAQETSGGPVNWIYYQLRLPATGSSTCTLYRSVTAKSLTGTPSATGGVPLTEQIINKSNGTCDTTGGTGTALFTYVCSGASPCNPQNIAQVFINMQAIPLQQDLQTKMYRALTLQNVVRLMNSSQ